RNAGRTRSTRSTRRRFASCSPGSRPLRRGPPSSSRSGAAMMNLDGVARTFAVRGLVVVCAVIAAATAPRAQQPVGLVPLDPPPPPLIVDGVEILKVQG